MIFIFSRSHSFNVPLVGVGNISSGGTGKTPFVEYLLKKYSKTFKTSFNK